MDFVANVRTTVSLRPDVYEGAKASYHELGFASFGDLVNDAVREYLHRRKIELQHRAMEVAARAPAYRALLPRISTDLEAVDSEGLGPEY